MFPVSTATAEDVAGMKKAVKSIPVLTYKETSDLEGLGILMKSLITSCEEKIHDIRMECGMCGYL